MAHPCRPHHCWAVGPLGGTPDGRPARPRWHGGWAGHLGYCWDSWLASTGTPRPHRPPPCCCQLPRPPAGHVEHLPAQPVGVCLSLSPSGFSCLLRPCSDQGGRPPSNPPKTKGQGHPTHSRHADSWHRYQTVTIHGYRTSTGLWGIRHAVLPQVLQTPTGCARLLPAPPHGSRASPPRGGRETTRNFTTPQRRTRPQLASWHRTTRWPSPHGSRRWAVTAIRGQPSRTARMPRTSGRPRTTFVSHWHPTQPQWHQQTPRSHEPTHCPLGSILQGYGV